MSVRDVLRNSAMFEELSDEEIDLLAKVMVERRVRDGHAFMKEGERPSSSGAVVFVVVDGQVEVTAGGRRLARLHKGELFGLVALVDDGARSATCTATGPTCVAGLSLGAFHLLHREQVALATRFQYLVARQLARNARRATEALRQLDETRGGESYAPSDGS